jgi:hypothetical protein
MAARSSNSRRHTGPILACASLHQSYWIFNGKFGQTGRRHRIIAADWMHWSGELLRVIFPAEFHEMKRMLYFV